MRPAPSAARTAVVAAVLLAALAGCSQDAPASQVPSTVDVTGTVVSAGVPIAGATVVLDRERNTTTGPDGRFAFAGLQPVSHLVEASAPGFLGVAVTVQPNATSNLTLELLPVPVPALEPYSMALHFTGHYDCAAETLIISGSCDAVLVEANDRAEEAGGPRAVPEPFRSNGTFSFDVQSGWRTMVLDVSFDPEATPGLDGFRLTLRTDGAESELTDYRNLGRFHGSEPFSVRIEPNATYDGGVEPVPSGPAVFQAELFPQGHFWHPAGQGVLGVGGAANARFDLYVTVFYVEPAPEGYTLLA